jgi:hypothetical protein
MDGVVIPRQIHRIWLGSPAPQDYVDNAQTWLDVNPGWTLTEWDEDSLLALGLENQDLWDEAAKHLPSRLLPRFRSDIARYELLWRFGGMYVDHDFVALKPIAPHIAGKTCFAVQEKPGLIANGLLGSVPGHPLMRLLIDQAPISFHKRPKQQPWRSVGPAFLTTQANGRGDLHILPKKLFLPYHYTELQRNGRGHVPHDAVCEHTWGSARGQVSVVIPYRRTDEHREAALAKVLQQFEAHHDWQVVIGTDDKEPFSKARAVNDGVRRSFGDFLVICDADLLCPDIEDAVNQCRKGVRWIMPYSILYRLSKTATQKVLRGADPLPIAKSRNGALDVGPYSGVIGGGVVVLRRSVYEDIPMDERFEGWGGEDISWGMALRSLAGMPRKTNGPLYHLWHPSKYIGAAHGENDPLYDRYLKASRRTPAMRTLVKEARKLAQV